MCSRSATVYDGLVTHILGAAPMPQGSAAPTRHLWLPVLGLVAKGLGCRRLPGRRGRAPWGAALSGMRHAQRSVGAKPLVMLAHESIAIRPRTPGRHMGAWVRSKPKARLAGLGTTQPACVCTAGHYACGRQPNAWAPVDILIFTGHHVSS